MTFNNLRFVVHREENPLDSVSPQVENNPLEDRTPGHVEHRFGNGVGEGSKSFAAPTSHNHCPVGPGLAPYNLPKKM